MTSMRLLCLKPPTHALKRSWGVTTCPGYACSNHDLQDKPHSGVVWAADADAAYAAAAAAAAAIPTTTTTASLSQDVLDTARISEVVRMNTDMCELLGGYKTLHVEQLLDGVINLVFRVQGSSGKSAVVKQALPYVRAVGESFPLSRERMDVEAAAMQLLHSCCPAYIPQLYLYDPQHSILAMQCAPPPHQKLLYCIRQGQVLPGLATQLAELLAAYLAHTSLALMTPGQQAAIQQQFANVDIVQANERVVLLSPFTPDDDSNRWTSPQLDDDVLAMWSNAAVMSSAAAMLHQYRSQREALIHNDLHAGNLLAAPGSLFLIDWEFATVGPVSFDIGCLLGNLMLALLSLKGMDLQETTQNSTAHPQPQQQDQVLRLHQQCTQQQHSDQQQQQTCMQADSEQSTRRQQAQWLLQVMSDVWKQFLQLYPSRLAAAAEESAAQPSGPLGDCTEDWQQKLLADSCGFAGCCLIRLTMGLHHYPDIQNIADDDNRASVERACLQLGQQLLLLRAAHTHTNSSADDSSVVSGSQEAAHSTVTGSGSSTACCSTAQQDPSSLPGPGLTMDVVQQLVRDACGSWLP